MSQKCKDLSYFTSPCLVFFSITILPVKRFFFACNCWFFLKQSKHQMNTRFTLLFYVSKQSPWPSLKLHRNRVDGQNLIKFSVASNLVTRPNSICRCTKPSSCIRSFFLWCTEVENKICYPSQYDQQFFSSQERIIPQIKFFIQTCLSMLLLHYTT